MTGQEIKAEIVRKILEESAKERERMKAWEGQQHRQMAVVFSITVIILIVLALVV